MSEFVKSMRKKKKKRGVNGGKSKVMRCSLYVNVGRMHVRLNCEPLKVDCFKYTGLQLSGSGWRI